MSCPRTLVGVCTFNEASNIRPLLNQIRAVLPEADIVVVDDDSPDGTAEIASEMQRVRCIVRRDERGLGSAIRLAMRTAIDGGYDLFCNLDADLSHDPEDLPRLVQAVATGNADVAVGSRYVDGGNIIGWPLKRRWMSGLINAYTRRRLRLPVRDASGSFRCYRVSELSELSLSEEETDGYAFLQSVLLQLHQNDASFVEVPITFTERQHGTSKLGIREAVRSGWTILRLRKSQDS